MPMTRLRIRPRASILAATPPAKRAWVPGITAQVLWWLLTLLWELTKAVMLVLVMLGGVVLIMIGVLAHFVGGPRR